ncbi:MAG: hypothetical protein JNK49_19750 [Planctomycetes bacterium]|nr:hypothetical protein [Planctomycetota bacterium]
MVLLVLHACTFMRPSTADPFGRSYDQLSELIDDVAEAQAAGLQPEEWLAKRDLPVLTDRASWDAILGELHARRASSLVRRAPVVSVTETWVGMLSSDYRRRSDASPVGFAIGCILVVPPALLLDVLVVPVTFSFSFVQGECQKNGVNGTARAGSSDPVGRPSDDEAEAR